jgi:hypothetical protein
MALPPASLLQTPVSHSRRQGRPADDLISTNRSQSEECTPQHRAFEAAVVADYGARTAVERELVLRLASLLWRLRRIISIETDLLKIQSDIVRERRDVLDEPSLEPKERNPSSTQSPPFALDLHQEAVPNEMGRCDLLPMSSRDLTCCFLRQSNVDNGAFERLGRYNAALWKQTAETFFLLQTVRRP